MFNYEDLSFKDFDTDKFKDDIKEERKNKFLQNKIDILVNVIRKHRDAELEELMFDEFRDGFDLNEAFEILEKYEKLELKVAKRIKENVKVYFE